MENYIDYIEKFLRGQMSQDEERAFKSSLTTDANLRLYAFFLTYMLRQQKSE